MPRIRALLLGTLLCAVAAARAGGEPVALPLQGAWQGDYPVNALDRLPAGLRESATGLLADAATFARVWQALRPGEAVPEVDFARQLVVFARNVEYYNRTRIFQAELADGIVQVLALETKSARPVAQHAAMALAVVPAAGVRGIDIGSGTYWLLGR